MSTNSDKLDEAALDAATLALYEYHRAPIVGDYRRVAAAAIRAYLDHASASRAPSGELEEAVRRHFWQWFFDCAGNLQRAAPDGNNPTGYKGPHPCDQGHFADDACARIAGFIKYAPSPVAPGDVVGEKQPGDADRIIGHDEALEAAQRLINSFFDNEHRARIGVPARPGYDDDLLVSQYIRQQKALSAAGLLAGQAVPNIDAAAQEVATWIGYSWDGMREERAVGFPDWTSAGSYQGGREGLRDLVRRVLTAAQKEG